MEPVRRRSALFSTATARAVLLTGAAALFLSFTHSLAFFFAFYCIARARASAPAPGWRTHRHVGDDELVEADATANAGPIV